MRGQVSCCEKKEETPLIFSIGHATKREAMQENSRTFEYTINPTHSRN
jgi:hypothetical protein